MKLNYGEYRIMDHVACPHCGELLEIEETYEESLSECYGDAQCPVCKGRMNIDCSVIFTADKVD